MPYPANYRYTREHEWIDLDGKIGAIGITDGMVRISVGIENVEDILEDLNQALSAI